MAQPGKALDCYLRSLFERSANIQCSLSSGVQIPLLALFHSKKRIPENWN